VSNVSSATVWVVVDPVFGDRLDELPIGEAVWVIQSTLNSAAAVRLRTKRVGETPLNGITTFTANSGATPEEMLVDYLATIDLHHGEYSSKPPYSKIRVIGAHLAPIVKEALSEFGFLNCVPTPNGFVAEKSVEFPKPT
jgi:hypothetical protein